MAKTKARKEHYVNNKEFLVALIEYRKAVDKAEKQKKEKPPVTKYIGECFLKIAQHLSYRPNFINYTYKHDMISDGIENCLMYIHNFNPDKSQNPFAYFTQIIYYAFLRRIQKEKKQTELKQKLIGEMMMSDAITTLEGDDAEYRNQYLQFLQENQIPTDKEQAIAKAKDDKRVAEQQSKEGALDEFME